MDDFKKWINEEQPFSSPEKQHDFKIGWDAAIKIKKNLSRSAAQNKLYWLMLTDMQNTATNEQAGRDKEEWHYFMKLNYLVKIFLRDDSDYAETWTAINLVYKNKMYKEWNILKNHVVNETSTTDCTVSQFTEYLEAIKNYCWQNGIYLKIDQWLWDMAVGK